MCYVSHCNVSNKSHIIYPILLNCIIPYHEASTVYYLILYVSDVTACNALLLCIVMNCIILFKVPVGIFQVILTKVSLLDTSLIIIHNLK